MEAERGRVERQAILAREHQLFECVRARQAADVCGEELALVSHERSVARASGLSRKSKFTV